MILTMGLILGSTHPLDQYHVGWLQHGKNKASLDDPRALDQAQWFHSGSQMALYASALTLEKLVASLHPTHMPCP